MIDFLLCNEVTSLRHRLCVWVGVSAVGTAILGICPPANAGRLLSLVLILAALYKNSLPRPNNSSSASNRLHFSECEIMLYIGKLIYLIEAQLLTKWYKCTSQNSKYRIINERHNLCFLQQ